MKAERAGSCRDGAGHLLRRSARAERGAGTVSACVLALLLSAGSARISEASPDEAARRIRSFASSPQSGGLSFCAMFVPVDSQHGRESRAEVARGEPGDGSSDTVSEAQSAEIRIGGATPLIPASLAKLTTTAMALEQLGPGYTFKTRLFADGVIQDSTLAGDLIIRGGGDPFLVSERLWLLAEQVRATGLRRVTGALVVDGSAFTSASADPARGAEREFSEKAYGARLSALAVNFNAAAFRVTPSAETGSRPQVTPDPLPCPYLRIDNRLISAPPSSNADSSDTGTFTVKLLPDGDGEVARFEGQIRAKGEPWVIYRSVTDPERFAAWLLRSFLAEAGIRIEGGVRAGVVSPQARLLLEFASPPLADLVGSTNRYSNNFMADLLAMALADSVPASLTRGAAEINRWLRDRFEADETIRLVDGSGLNPADRLNGNVLAALLERSWNDLRVQPDFVASLPVPGEEGTLHRRFAGSTPVLRGKTGTMSDPPASGIAGYLQRRAGSRHAPVAFVILMNAAPGEKRTWDIPRMQALQESWIRTYLE
jgi:serine-type D-Ala-D-Ala carboxypeptidase/endopeptidase (penicillin-binding protein 4)